MRKSYIVKGILVLVILSGLTLLTYNYVFHEHRNIGEESPSFEINAAILIQEFRADTNASTEKYLDQTISVTGKISSIEDVNLAMDNGISCYFETALNNYDLLLNTTITVKGRCLGYDDLLEEIKMDQCVLIKN